MPNTLAHFGLQTIASKAADRTTEVKWIAVGCIIPDIPWITQRLISFLAPGVDLLSLRVYCLIQASFFFCLVISGAIALLNRNSARLFLVLGGNSLAHLLLDAAQTKWANGVHLFVPFNWQLSQFQLFWPESTVTIVLTAAGLIIVAYYGWQERQRGFALERSFFQGLVASALLLFYVLLPFIFFSEVFEADNHYVQTILDKTERPGKTIGFDRCRYDTSTAEITVFTGETFHLIADQSLSDGTISLRGRFAEENTIVASMVHQHGRSRDVFSYAGLSLLLFLWVGVFLRETIRNN